MFCCCYLYSCKDPYRSFHGGRQDLRRQRTVKKRNWGIFDELGIAEPKHSKSAYHKDESRHHSQTSQGVASAAVYFISALFGVFSITGLKPATSSISFISWGMSLSGILFACSICLISFLRFLKFLIMSPPIQTAYCVFCFTSGYMGTDCRIFNTCYLHYLPAFVACYTVK